MTGEPRPAVVQAAAVVVARHRDGRCQTCRPDSCAELAWAQPVVAGWEARWMAAALEAAIPRPVGVGSTVAVGPGSFG